MGTAADLLTSRPTVKPYAGSSVAGKTPSPQKIDVLPASAFDAKVSGIDQRFELGVQDNKMVILRRNSAGGYFVLPTGVPSGGQSKLASDSAVMKFTENDCFCAADANKKLCKGERVFSHNSAQSAIRRGK
jgi:hypothetical protein